MECRWAIWLHTSLIAFCSPANSGNSLRSRFGSRCAIESASNVFEVGVACRTSEPQCVVLDFALGQDACEGIARRLRSEPASTGTLLIGVAERGQFVKSHLFDDVFREPVDLALLTERIRGYLNVGPVLDQSN